MAKIDLVKSLIAQFPDEKLTEKGLMDGYTVTELEALKVELEAGVSVKTEEGAEQSAALLVRLADPKTSYSSATFSLAGKQEKPWPDNPSNQLQSRKDSGFIIEVN